MRLENDLVTRGLVLSQEIGTAQLAFQSEFQDNSKLNLCAQDNAHHIGEHTSPAADRAGEHVRLIQKALNAWLATQPAVDSQGKRKPAALTENGNFDKATGDLVAFFKTKKNILNFENRIDRIVGIKTVAELDKQLPAKSVPPPAPPTKVTLDVIVKFRGILGTPAPLPASEVMNKALVLPYLQKHKDARSLLLIGHQTIKIDNEGKSIRDKMMAAINSALADKQLGKVFVYGSSSGGRNSLSFVDELNQMQRLVEYVAAIDAAFFQPDTTDRPDNFTGEPTIIPTFNKLGLNLSAGTKWSFFQTAGNHSKVRLSGRLFTSEMDGEEIHGKIAGFGERNVTSQVVAHANQFTGKDHDDQAHIKAAAVALPMVHTDIAAILNAI